MGLFRWNPAIGDRPGLCQGREVPVHLLVTIETPSDPEPIRALNCLNLLSWSMEVAGKAVNQNICTARLFIFNLHVVGILRRAIASR
jgi:hypothetical protein